MSEDICRRGHSDWVRRPDNGWRYCRKCRAEQARRYRQQCRPDERYNERRPELRVRLDRDEYDALVAMGGGSPQSVIRRMVRAAMLHRGSA